MRIGIVGAGMIVRTCLENLCHSEKVRCTALCVRPRSVEKGRALAEEFGVPRVFTDYRELLESDEVDIIYIGIVNRLHHSWARQALEAGRHVILEKPFTCTAEEARDLAGLAREKELLLFEAITSLYTPAFLRLRERLPHLGEIKMVQCNYSQYSSRYDRYRQGEVTPAFDPVEYGGALFDINIYNLHIVAALFGTPLQTDYLATPGFNGVDTSGIVTLRYQGFPAVCCGAKDSGSPGLIQVQGTRGCARIEDAPNVCGRLELIIDGEREELADPRAGWRMLPELEAFARMWREEDREGCYRMLDHTVRVMELLCAAQAAGGLRLGPDAEKG